MNKNKTDEIAKMIDHSVLHPVHTDADLKKGCKTAARYGVASMCVKPYAVRQAVEYLENSGVPVASVIGFPHGNSSIEVKIYETEEAIDDGAKEIDMVPNLGKVLQEDWKYVEAEIAAIVSVTCENNALLKVIFENDYLPTDHYKIRLCELCSALGVDFVKTSTGFGFFKDKDGYMVTRGATIADVRLMRKHTGEKVRVKASGGIRSLDQLLALKEAGAERIGTSATEAIMEEALSRFGK
ncbi:MAG TPA: deoxyribose-phosphate aldolase [Bacteroidetes bacterium]|nr:deoxyribose-phosphate aldolase [Bacteroidota bacterium]